MRDEKKMWRGEFHATFGMITLLIRVRPEKRLSFAYSTIEVVEISG